MTGPIDKQINDRQYKHPYIGTYAFTSVRTCADYEPNNQLTNRLAGKKLADPLADRAKHKTHVKDLCRQMFSNV